MIEECTEISRRGFVATAGATALGIGLAGGLIGCSSEGTGASSEATSSSSDETSSTSETKGEFKQFAAYDRDAGEWIPTSCNMCFCNCGIEVHVVDGVAVEIRGNEGSSVGSGTICPKGCSGLMQLYDPSRITKPMKRTNPNKSIDEDPGWEEISWDEAYDLMAEHIGKAVEEDPVNGFAWFGMIASLYGLHSLFESIGPATGGTPTWIPADTCGQGIHTVTDLYTGDGNAGPDWKYCKYMLAFGTQAGIATRHGFNISTKQWAERRDEGARMVCFDPHLSAGPEKADLWVPIRPGTDAAAAIAIANVMVNELEQYDVEFLKETSYMKSRDNPKFFEEV